MLIIYLLLNIVFTKHQRMNVPHTVQYVASVLSYVLYLFDFVHYFIFH